MSLFIETIKCKDGELQNLRFHQARFNLTRKQNLGIKEEIDLAETIDIPGKLKTGLFRCRMIYSETIKKIEFIPYMYRKIQTLKLLEDNEIDYPFKFANRKRLNKLFEMRGNCDDILIVKNDCITDSYTANVVFSDGHDWWTSNTPLLPGTQRARLIDERKIKVCRITVRDLPNFEKAGLINAMQNLEEMPVVEMEGIF